METYDAKILQALEDDTSETDDVSAPLNQPLPGGAENFDGLNTVPTPEYSPKQLKPPATRIAIAAAECYTRHTMDPHDHLTIYFENSPDYVDSFLELYTENGLVTLLNVAFTIPPNEENPEWVSYNAEITNLKQLPSLKRCEEILQNGTVNKLGAEYHEWLADCFEVVLTQPLAPDNVRPPQQAPSAMY